MNHRERGASQDLWDAALEGKEKQRKETAAKAAELREHLTTLPEDLGNGMSLNRKNGDVTWNYNYILTVKCGQSLHDIIKEIDYIMANI